MDASIKLYNQRLGTGHRQLCEVLCKAIEKSLTDAEGRIWHAHPVWFLDGNPIVGYSQQKRGIRVMFWSGIDFEEPGLDVLGRKFKDASVFWNKAAEVDKQALARWLRKARRIQWNYRDLVKRKGRLERLV